MQRNTVPSIAGMRHIWSQTGNTSTRGTGKEHIIQGSRT